METNQINHLRVRGWVYNRKYKRYREDVIAYQCASQKSFSRYNATLFFLLGILYLLLDRFLWNKFQVGTLFYFVVALFSTVNYLLYQKILPMHKKYVVAAGCLYILIMQKLLLSLNIIGGGAVSWTLLLCSFLSTSLVIVVPSYYFIVTSMTVVLDVVEYSFSNPDIVYIFYNLLDDLIIASFCIGINFIFSRLKYEELERKESLYCESSRDPLTWLYNRRYLERYFEGHADYHKNCAILMLDLDNFKMANDVFGHQKGDEVLCQTAQILRDNFREDDCIARLGGDEFAVFIPDFPEMEVIERRVQRVLECFPIVIEGDTTVEVSVSMGVVLKEADHVPSYTELCDRADDAMYQAKKAGKAKAVIAGDGELKKTIH